MVWIIKYHRRCFESNAVFIVVPGVFIGVPFKFHKYILFHMYKNVNIFKCGINVAQYRKYISVGR